MNKMLTVLIIVTGLTAYSIAEDAPTIEVTKPLVNVGLIRQNTRTNFTYTIKNSGKSPLFLLEVNPGCQCTYIADYPSEVAPDDSVMLNGIIESTYMEGTFEKVIVLTTNDPENPKQQLLLTGNVENTIEFYPSLFQYSNLFQDTGVVQRKVRLSHIQSKKITIKEINTHCNYLTVINDTSSASQQKVVTFILHLSKIPQSTFSYFGVTMEFLIEADGGGVSKEYYNAIVFNDKLRSKKKK